MKKLSFLLCLLFMAVSMLAQDIKIITTEKPGKFAKALGKENPENITRLKISGYIDEKDMTVLKKCVNLEYLDVSETHFIHSQYKSPLEEFTIPSNKIKDLIFTTESGVSVLKSATYKDVAKNINDYVNSHHTMKILVGKGMNNLYCSSYNAIEYWGYYEKKDIHIKNIHIFDVEEELIRSKGEVNCEKLILASNNSSPDWESIKSNCDYYVKEDLYVLNKWFPEFKDEDFSKVAILGDQAMSEYPGKSLSLPRLQKIGLRAFYRNRNIQRVELSSKVKSIPNGCFWECENLQEVIMPGVEYIEEYAFEDTKITDIVLPESFKGFEDGTGLFSSNGSNDYSTLTIKGQIPPECPFKYEMKRLKVIVPDGRINAYKKVGWDKTWVVDSKTKTSYEFNVETPGLLGNYLTEDICPNVETLELSGHIDDLDFELLTKCKNIRSLDLENCYISESVETAKRRKAQGKALAAYFGLVFNEAARKAAMDYKYRGGSLADAVITESIADAANPAISKTLNDNAIDVEELCILPCDRDYWSWYANIERILLPKWLVSLDMFSYSNNSGRLNYTKYLKLPEAATNISIRGNSRSPMVIVVQKNAEDVEFRYCTMEELDLSKTKTKRFCNDIYSHNDGTIHIFKGSPVLNDVILRMTDDGVAYFYTKERPEKFKLMGCKEVHIPRGCKADWVTAAGDGRNYIDDIDL